MALLQLCLTIIIVQTSLAANDLEYYECYSNHQIIVQQIQDGMEIDLEQARLILLDIVLNNATNCTHKLYHQSFCSWLGTNVFHGLYWHNQLSQISLVELMQYIIHLNYQIGIGLDVADLL